MFTDTPEVFFFIDLQLLDVTRDMEGVYHFPYERINPVVFSVIYKKTFWGLYPNVSCCILQDLRDGVIVSA